ncbi:GntR family transcriptional regulator [Garciella nitratireducens]|uniref:Transcriptional regulator, GntR family n=1 Tax=Garciella nitratireducens DSM 15102 TaxID=1121911 RepID=A0A1T4MG11_9FIRM|nr:GntR family transcriptional regulator [Garciella nitratireducens]RBP39879.1 GntR family transcriptional regulator [Garciella nitratireducens]SJZ65787.1 transcriptional regulator, GntR family [Garciella nitratireducens DSM 15102]
MMEIDMNNYRPLREIVFETLKEAILKGDIEPGTRMMEVQLAEQLGVSRTPVREAIRQLELEGLVVMIPRKGAYVAGLSTKDCMEVLEIRTSLEGLAAQLAAQRAKDHEIKQLFEISKKFSDYAQSKDVQGLIDEDETFHDVIYIASRNDRLIQLISSLREQVQRFRVAYISQFKRASDLVEEHQQILDAISKGDGIKARMLSEEHIKNLKDSMKPVLKEYMNEDCDQ